MDTIGNTIKNDNLSNLLVFNSNYPAVKLNAINEKQVFINELLDINILEQYPCKYRTFGKELLYKVQKTEAPIVFSTLEGNSTFK